MQRRGYDWTGSLYWFLLATVAVVQIVPLLVIKYLPLVDLPNHESRIAILAHYGSNPTMKQFYVVDWRPIPDLAFDLFAVPLVRLGLSPLDAARAFLTVAVLLYCAGGHLLAKALAGRRSWIGVVLPLLFYSSMLFYGFINFVFGFGIFLLTYALWLGWRRDLRPPRAVCVSGLLVVAYLSHLAAFGLLALAIVVSVALDQLRGRSPWRAAARSLLMLLPALALLAYSSATRGSSSGGISWGSVREKASVLGGMFLSYDHKLDALWIGGAILIALIGLGLARRVALDPPAAILAVVFGLCFLVLPPSLVSASNVDARVVPALVALCLCAVRLPLRPQAAAALATCVVALAGSRVIVVAVQWQHLSTTIGAQVHELDAALPRNANVYSLFPEDGPQIDKRERSFAHVASYAAIDRNAHVSRTFAERSQQPLVSRFDEQAALDAVPRLTVNFRTLQRYDYLWTYQPSATVRRQLRGRCSTVYDSDGFYLCRRG